MTQLDLRPKPALSRRLPPQLMTRRRRCATVKHYFLYTQFIRKLFKVVLLSLAVLVATRLVTHLVIVPWSTPASPALAMSTAPQPDLAPASAPTSVSAIVGSREEQQAFMQGVVATMNAAYPKSLPSGVRIDRVSYDLGHFIFHKTFTEHTVDMFDQDELLAKRPAMVAEMCASTAADMLVKGADAIGYRVSDKNGVLIHEYYANKVDCDGTAVP